MKKLTLSFALCLCICLPIAAQMLPGFNTSNYDGVTGAFSNPSNILSRYKWDVHLFGMGVNGANETMKVKLRDIGSDHFVSNKLIGQSGYNSANVNLEIPALGFLAGLGKKSSVAFTTRGRVFVNADHVHAELITALNEEEGTGHYPYTFNAGNPSLVSSSAITDYAFTWANEIINKGPHYIKGGITLKYVSGVGNMGLNTNIAGILNKDDEGEYLSPATGNIDMRTGGSAFAEDFEMNQLLKFEGGGFGGELGIIYEFRREGWKNAGTNKELRQHGNIPYQFKFGVSLMDIGKVSFTPDTSMSKNYAVHIPSDDKFYLSNIDEIDGIPGVLEEYPQFFTRTGITTSNYKVSLPTTLRVMFDYNIGKGFFVNLDAQIAMKSSGSMDNIRAYNNYVLTPRYEGKTLGVFLPVSVSQLSGFTVGAALHVGPLYIGSGSILSLLTGGGKQADAFFGFRFGGLK